MQRNGPAACYNLLSALERRRQEQEDAGLNPTPLAKSLYKVTHIKRILSSIVNECRAARNEVPSKNGTISWDQVTTSSIVTECGCRSGHLASICCCVLDFCAIAVAAAASATASVG